MLLLLQAGMAAAQTFINLTPKPKQMTVGKGELVLPQEFAVGYGALPDSLAAEARRFVAAFNAASGYAAKVQAGGEALVTMELLPGAADEGYRLDVTESGVGVKARTAAGFYFAFQTLKKILPPNVMAGVRDAKVDRYALPVVSIEDEPRFGYRGFMLDVARHFFTVEEVKRMLDVMSYYKMNRFHWHLSDDQGWRVEIKKYPRLTTVGATASNCYVTDLEYGPYWTNKQYGPHFYTQEEIRDVVAYARDRHIEVIPEIDMPGHFVAAMAAYPEYSCWPDGNHTVWTWGGVSTDVLNVGNPAAVQFAKDILDELADLFPFGYFNIGGDECPTGAWEGNAQCQARYRELGLTNYRQLQSHFIKEMADFLKTKGKKVSVWNEAITASGADVNLIKEAGATVYCWTGAAAAAKKAAQLGLDNVYTPQPVFYINRKQSTDDCEATLPGNGTDNVQAVYNEVPVPASGLTAPQLAHYTGVQGTFWTEHVADRELLEYLALPRLIAVAETGWTPQGRKDFGDFRRRITADTLLLGYNGYRYGRHYLLEGGGETPERVMPKSSTNEKRFYYRLATRATDSRAGKCMELLRAGSPLIAEYGAKGAAAGVLWTNAQAGEGEAAYDYQFWAFEEDPARPGHYAIVNKAVPEGSVNPTPTAYNNTGRWNYSPGEKHYDFLIGDNGYGSSADKSFYYYSIRSEKAEDLWVNASLAGQGFAVNLYGDPADGSGGLWNFKPMAAAEGAEALEARLVSVGKELAAARTYETEAGKRPGMYGAAETAALRELVDKADPATMNAAQLEAFAVRLDEAYAAFRASFARLETGKAYRFANAVDGFARTAFADNGTGGYLRHTPSAWADDAWEVTATATGSDGHQLVKLRNKATGRFVGAAASATTGNVAYPIGMGTAGGDLLLAFNASTHDYTVSSSGKNLFPVDDSSAALPGTVSSGSIIQGRNAVRPMGAAWDVVPVCVVTYVCKDEQGTDLGTFRQSAVAGEAYTCAAPAIKNHAVLRYAATGTAEAPVVDAVAEDLTVEVVYRRAAYTVRTVARDQHGALIAETEATVPVGEAYTLEHAVHPYYSYAGSDYEGPATFTPQADMTVTDTYATEAYNGVRKLAAAVSRIEDGKSYVLYDTSPRDTERIGYRNVNPATRQVMQATRIEDTDPYFTWTMEKSGSGFKVKHEYTQLYIPQLVQSGKIILAKAGDTFTFTLNDDGETWKIKGTNGQYWDGVAGSFTGWHTYGHPYKIYEYYAQPYFEVTVRATDTTGHELSTASALVKAGEPYTLTVPAIEGYTMQRVENADALEAVAGHVTVDVVYARDTPEGIAPIEGASKHNAIFDLSGRRLNRISGRGIYIVDGKKVYVR